MDWLLLWVISFIIVFIFEMNIFFTALAHGISEAVRVRGLFVGVLASVMPGINTLYAFVIIFGSIYSKYG